MAWVPYGSGKFASLDRRKCKILPGPTATGQQRPEGWTFFDMPGPKIANTDINSDFYYTDFLDQFDTLGLGKDIPIANSTNSDSLIAVLPETGKTVVVRVPYPMDFYSRVMDGRIDDAKAGWKGKGIYATYSNVPVWHQEGGNDGQGPELVYFQVRPDPLAH